MCDTRLVEGVSITRALTPSPLSHEERGAREL
jgi:hypothetical protein